MTSKYCPNILKIDLNLLVQNVKNISEVVAPSKVGIAVKADAYGHGVEAVAKKLDESATITFCVSSPDEALYLREIGINSKVLLLSEPVSSAVEALVKNKIDMTVYSARTINEIASFSSSKIQPKVHLKINTGMNRVGCETEEALNLARQISSQDNLIFEGIFTHFATADEEIQDGVFGQLKKFEYVISEIFQEGIEPNTVHSANSAAAISIPEARFDMVRIGLSAYGLYPASKMQNSVSISPVAELTSKVSFIKRVHAGESISYGWKHNVKKDTNIVTLPIGYGDGIPRDLGLKGGEVLIEGNKYPIVGVVTMDQLMVEVGDQNFSVGTNVTLIGKQDDQEISFSHWATALDTIPYVLMCQISDRIPRVYV